MKKYVRGKRGGSATPSSSSGEKNSAVILRPDECLYGILPVEAALKYKRRALHELWLKQDFESNPRLRHIEQLARELKLAVQIRPKSELDASTEFALNQGVVLKCGTLGLQRDPALKVAKEDQPVYGVLDQVEDPHNLGAIIRSAAFFGVRGLVVTARHSPSITAVVSKSSAGIAEWFPLYQVNNLSQWLIAMKKNGFWVVGFSMESQDRIQDLKRDRPLMLVLGNEGKGVRRLVGETCDWLVNIPGDPQVESLNVSNAAAVAFYHLNSQI